MTHKIYNPMTASPFRCNEAYMEWKPCRELQPFVKCFWGSKGCYRKAECRTLEPEVITPDTCVDIIFELDFTGNQIHGGFVGINDRTFVLVGGGGEDRLVSQFAIRFYAWTAILFSEEPMSGSKNKYYELDYHFSKLKKEIEPLLFDVIGLEERVQLAQVCLLRHLHEERRHSLLMDAVAQMLEKRGNIRVGQLCRDIHASGRQLDRLFEEDIGISPKQLASLIRYQYVWNDVLWNPRFQMLDAVHQYGYTDQSHLARDFKRFHSMNISEARKYARGNI